MRRRINGSDRDAFAIGLGAMPLSIAGRPDRRQARTTIAAALDSGVDFIDTADCYCLDDDDFGHNEALIAEVLSQLDRKDVLVSTKGGIRRPGGDWTSAATPAQLRGACEASLLRLGVDCLPLYHLHAPDPRVPFEESVGELGRLREAGKIDLVGLSNVDRDQIETARRIVPIATVQNRCNVYFKQDMTYGLVEWCDQQRISYLAYSPVGGHNGHVRLADDDTLRAIANRHETTVYCVALAWLLAKNPAVLPIPGASRAESINASVTAAAIKLTDEEIAAIDALPDQP